VKLLGSYDIISTEFLSLFGYYADVPPTLYQQNVEITAAESAVCFPLFKTIHIPFLTAGNYSDMNEIAFQNTAVAIYSLP